MTNTIKTPPPSPPLLSTAAEIEAYSASQMDRYEAAHTFTSYAASAGASQWIMPPGLEAFTVARLRPRNDANIRERGREDMREADLLEFGWVPADPRIRHADYMSDGDAKRWLMIGPDGHARYQARKRHEAALRRSKHDPLDQAAHDLDGIKGVNVSLTERRMQRQVRLP